MATNAPPAEIASMLRAACYDCHSHETKWPWYSNITPFSWWLIDHVNDGRQRLNFSDWPQEDPRRASRRWSMVADEVHTGSMPLPDYLRMHPEARLTGEQRKRLVAWAEQEAGRLRALVPPEDE